VGCETGRGIVASRTPGKDLILRLIQCCRQMAAAIFFR
jgi:hypothetical protein